MDYDYDQVDSDVRLSEHVHGGDVMHGSRPMKSTHARETHHLGDAQWKGQVRPRPQ